MVSAGVLELSGKKKGLEKELLMSVVSCHLQFFLNLSLVDYLGISPYVSQSRPPPGLPISILLLHNHLSQRKQVLFVVHGLTGNDQIPSGQPRQGE